MGRTKTYVKSLTVLLFPCMGCLLALIVKMIEMDEQYKGFQKLIDDADWAILKSANVSCNYNILIMYFYLRIYFL